MRETQRLPQAGFSSLSYGTLTAKWLTNWNGLNDLGCGVCRFGDTLQGAAVTAPLVFWEEEKAFSSAVLH